jgi:hypothetical protein
MAGSRDEIERILDDGISSYSDAEPLTGIEERIVARIRSAKAPRLGLAALGLAGLSIGLAVAASLFLLVSRNQPQPVAIVSETKPLTIELAPRPAPVRMPKPRRAARMAALPKERMFPTPSSVTREEHLLLVLVTNHPEEAAEGFESLRQRANEPVEIPPLVIEPLE